MKKLIFSFCFILVLLTDSHGQWYSKKYGVPSINALTIDQLDEASHDTKTNIWMSCVVIGVGGIVYFVETLLPYDIESDENPTWFKELIGEKAVHVSIQAFGIGIAAAGTVACIAFVGRYATIRYTMRRINNEKATLAVSPLLIPNFHTPSVCAGLGLTCRF